MLRNPRWLPLAGLSLLLALFLGRLLCNAAFWSFTADEPAYVGTGLHLWRSGDYDPERVLLHHPPLAHHLASLALPLLVPGPLPDGPGVGGALLQRASLAPERLHLAARVPFVLLAAWGAVVAFVWARAVAGPAAGLLAAFLYTLSPSMLAYGALAHSDGPLAVFFLQTLATLWWLSRRSGAAARIACGLSLGLALAAKITALMLLPIAGVALGVAALGEARRGRGARAALRRVAGDGAVVGGVAVAVLWAVYGGSFQLAPAPGGALGGLPLPAYLRSLLWVDAANTHARPVYFLGEISRGRIAAFFPVAFALKETVGMLVLTAAALVSLGWRRGRLGAFLAFPVALYLATVMGWLQVPLGWRYALPLVPIACVFVATQLAPVRARGPRIALLCGCAAVALESAAAAPHELAFFNVLAGGPDRGHRFLLESNLDWGQDVGTLARELAARGVDEPVWLALFATEDPARYGVQGRRLPGCRPVGGWLAISENVRRGLYAAHSVLRAPVPGCYAWLDAYEPVARPGHSILLYDLPAPAQVPDRAPRPQRKRAP